MAYGFAPISSTAATLSLVAEKHGNGVILSANKADGFTYTLPAATGSGEFFKIRVGTSITSSAGVIAALTTDIIEGVLSVTTDTTGVTVPTSATSDKISMNGGTTGGIAGSYVELTDVAAGKWLVGGFLISTGAEATPFSAT